MQKNPENPKKDGQATSWLEELQKEFAAQIEQLESESRPIIPEPKPEPFSPPMAPGPEPIVPAPKPFLYSISPKPEANVPAAEPKQGAGGLESDALPPPRPFVSESEPHPIAPGPEDEPTPADLSPRPFEPEPAPKPATPEPEPKPGPRTLKPESEPSDGELDYDALLAQLSGTGEAGADADAYISKLLQDIGASIEQLQEITTESRGESPAVSPQPIDQFAGARNTIAHPPHKAQKDLPPDAINPLGVEPADIGLPGSVPGESVPPALQTSDQAPPPQREPASHEEPVDSLEPIEFDFSEFENLDAPPAQVQEIMEALDDVTQEPKQKSGDGQPPASVRDDELFAALREAVRETEPKHGEEASPPPANPAPFVVAVPDSPPAGPPMGPNVTGGVEGGSGSPAGQAAGAPYGAVPGGANWGGRANAGPPPEDTLNSVLTEWAQAEATTAAAADVPAKPAQKSTKTLIGDIAAILGMVLLALLLALGVCTQVFPNQFQFIGYHAILIRNDAMEPELPKNSLILVKATDFGDINAGDIVAVFSQGSLKVRYVQKNEGFALRVKAAGDVAPDEALITEEQVVGKMWQKVDLYVAVAVLAGVMLVILLLYFFAIRRFVKRSKRRKSLRSAQPPISRG